MAEPDAEKPVLQVTRNLKTGKLRIRLPTKGAKWHGAFDDLSAAAHAANEAGVGPPLVFDFVDPASVAK